MNLWRTSERYFCTVVRKLVHNQSLATMNMKSLLSRHKSEIALVVGNGVNLYGSAKSTNSWRDLLVRLAGRHLPPKLRNVPSGLSLTEFYDLLELKASSKTLQEEFCTLLDGWTYHPHHERIVRWATKANTPILTTNFDQVLSEAGQCSLHRTKKTGFTDYYPWDSYYGNGQIQDPAREFGIWHINGMRKYHRSIRLGLTHYMGSVEKARAWLHKGNKRRLFSGQSMSNWDGSQSWVHAIFNCKLLIFGLSLEEDEVFLRWLLIERARYFRKFPKMKKQAWYVYAGAHNNEGKQYFLEGVGVTPLRVPNYDEIYGAAVWK